MGRPHIDDQEKRVVQVNIRLTTDEQVDKMASEIQEAHKEVLSCMESYRTKHRMLGYFVYRPSVAAQIFRTAITQACLPLFMLVRVRQAVRNTKQAIGVLINTAFKIPQVLSLATLLDIRNGGGDLGPAARRWPLQRQAGLLTILLLMML